MEEIIRTVNLTKQYGNKVIVDRVSISVKKVKSMDSWG